MLRIRVRASVSALTSVLMILAVAPYGYAQAFETQDNPVPDGTIQVADGDADRSDWEGIPWYETDEDFDEFFPVDIDRVQVAHDSQNVYFHVQALTWDVEETWRIGIYIDTDEDEFTGYTGNFLAVGGDYLIEAGIAYEFDSNAQADWDWDPVAELDRDQSVFTDFEVAVPRDTLDGSTLLNFVLFANNACCDFGLPDDVYPNGGAVLAGEFFSYELSPVALAGDFDGNGVLDADDINDLTTVVANQTGGPLYDLNNDSLVNEADIRVWVKDLFGSWIGDANLDGEFTTRDLVTVLASGSYESDVDAVWTTGDFNGDARTTTSDLVAALADGGYENGPAGAVAAVPEPTTWLAALLALAMLTRHRRDQSS